MPYLRAAGLLACVLALAGCALGEEGSPDEIIGDELAIMVLPQGELGSEYAAFAVDDDSGRGTARDLAEGTFEPNDTAASVKRSGWTAGYDLTYSTQKRLAADRRAGAVSAGTSADLFATETGARSFILTELRHFRRFEGKTREGVKILRTDEFDVTVGDEGWGVEFEFRGSGATLTMTGVIFRHGRLVATAFYLRADDADVRPQAASLALKLENRIERVLAGDLDAKPVPLPAGKPAVSQAQLARMTLSVKDLPGEARVAEEGRFRGGANYVSYYRNFDVSNTMIGSSHLLFLRAQTDVFETEKGAEAVMRYLGTAKGRALFAREVQTNIRRDFKKAAAGRPRNFDVRELANAGPGAKGIVITFDLPTGRYRIASIFVRSGRAVAMVSGFCNAHAVHPEDMPPLGEEARERLASIPA